MIIKIVIQITNFYKLDSAHAFSTNLQYNYYGKHENKKEIVPNL